VINAIAQALQPVVASGKRPVVLTNSEIRRFVRKLLESDLPQTAVLSFDELPGELTVQPMGRAQIGARAYTRDAEGARGAKNAKGAKARGAKGAEGRLVDRITRDEGRNPMLALVSPDEEEEKDSLAQPSGHSSGLRPFTGEAFRTGPKGKLIPPTFSDVDQGNLGDAWLLAACAAVAAADPEQLVRRVSKNYDGGFTVRLGPDSMRVTAEFSNERYADPTPNGQADTLWVALIEKSFALREAGSYENLEVGNPSRALELLTGRPTTRVSLYDGMGLEALGRQVAEAKKTGRAMVLRTRDSEVQAPLLAEHCYAVLDWIPTGSALRLYNPWGTKNRSRPLEELVHEIPLAALAAQAETLHMVSGGR
jgi:hypothetical protein